MSLNKVMLIGNVGKDPEVRYIEAGVATATLSLATSTPGYTLPAAHRCPSAPNGIVFCCSDAWQKLWSATYTKETSSTSKVPCVHAVIQTNWEKRNTLPKFGLRIWKC